MAKAAGIAPRRRCSCVDQIVVHHFCCPVSDAVHPLSPQHLILGLELFGDALTGGHLFAVILLSLQIIANSRHPTECLLFQVF